ncbi:MAG TPA: hypothetical protein VET48_01305 [Steroidobacteraceae bacterium]|nr:hypothetical protein [Steroidobacteraceae bacterium]
MFETRSQDSLVLFTGTSTERREAAERERLHRAAVREESLAELTSPELEPWRRIALWEQLHGLYLPGDPKHALVKVIAARTALRVEEVRNEQLRRSAARAGQNRVEPRA